MDGGAIVKGIRLRLGARVEGWWDRIAQGSEREEGGVGSGACFSSVRVERHSRLLKPFINCSQQHKDDQDRVPIFQEFTSLAGENGYIRSQEKY